MKAILWMFALMMAAASGASAAATAGQNITTIHYLASPNITWTSSISPLLKGNGIFLSPDDHILVSTSLDGTVNSFHPSTGAILWTHQPVPINNSLLSCHSGVTFSSNGSFFIYSVIDNEGSPSEMTRVIAVNSLSGQELWQSAQLVGVASGTPVLSSDDQFVYLTHNSASTTVGHFSILATTTTTTTTNNSSSSSTKSRLLFTSINTTNPYASPGIYHSPVEGYYDGGEGNQNDILVWAYTAKPTDVKVGTGGLFAFQFPIGFSTTTRTTSSASFVIQYLGDNNIDFQSVSKPVITNQGLSMYYAGSRSQWRCWVGSLGQKANYFNRARTALLAFERGTPPSSPAFNTLALSHHNSDVEPMVFGGTASMQFASANYNFSNVKNVTTNSVVMTEARVSPDDLVVYYTEVDGFLHQANTSTLADVWMEALPAPVKAEMDLQSDGSMIYIGDVSGNVIAYQVALGPPVAPTMAPSMSPSTTTTVLAPTLKPVAPHTATTNSSSKPAPAVPTHASPTTTPIHTSSLAPQALTKPTTPSSTASIHPAVATASPTPSTSLSTTLPSLGGSVAASPTVVPVGTTLQPVVAAPKSSSACSLFQFRWIEASTAAFALYIMGSMWWW